MKHFLLILLTPLILSAAVEPLFQPASLTAGPFPANALTAPAANQMTGVQMNLPQIPCSPGFAGAVCGDVSLLNVLDGFSVNPRTMVCFSGPINPATLQNGVSYVPLNGIGNVSINQVFYDPSTNCAFFKPNQVLQQQTSYLLTITSGVQDTNRQSTARSPDFQTCIGARSSVYCTALSNAVTMARPRISGNLIAASLFTTMSTTNWLERARQFAHANEPPIVLPAGAVSTFKLSNLSALTWFPQDDSGNSPPTSESIPLSVLSNVDSVAFGLFFSPNFLNVQGPLAGSITVTPTNAPIQSPVTVPGVPQGTPAGFEPVSFHVFLPPASKSPPNGRGFPVVIYGHGLGDNQFGAPTYFASTLAANGFAVLAFEITGHGFGPASYVVATDKHGNNSIVATPGRGLQLAPGPISPGEGCLLPGALAVRDCGRQSAVDLYALVSLLRETNGFGYLDPTRIYYVGQSFGSIYGTLFHAVEPAVTSAAMSGDGGTSVDIARLAISGRPLAIEFLGGFTPSLLNVPPAPQEVYFHDNFNDNYVFRDQPPVVNHISGAPAIQAAFELADWTSMVGDALAFAPHLTFAPLSGVPPKLTLFQFGLGDLEVPNPTESAVIRAAGALLTTWYFRFDIASSLQPVLLGIESPGVPFPILPHRILSNPTIFNVPAEQSIALAEQQQIATFFETGLPLDPDLFLKPPFSPFRGLFQFAPTPLPEALNFLQIPQ